MGVALSKSADPGDAALWADWYRFTLEMAVAGAFSEDATERKMARVFIETAISEGKSPLAGDFGKLYASPVATRAALEALPPSADHMFFFEYNFLHVLAAGGRPEKSALGDHSPAGYAQRARHYSISDVAQLHFAKGVAAYLIFLAETTGLVAPDRCGAVRRLLDGYTSLDAMLGDISR
jgi:hypothetical protein